jgi:hypothetical protein
MVEEPSHVKQLLLNHVCKIGLQPGVHSTHSVYFKGGHKEMSSSLADQKSFLVYEPKFGGWGVGCGVSALMYSCARGAQINFGDQTPYLTYGLFVL